LSLGAEVDFFFGNMNNRQFIAFPDSAETHNLRISRDDHLYGLAYKFGAQYKKVIRTTIQIDSLGTTEDVDHQLYFGINLQSEAKLSGSRISLSERYTLGQSGIAFIRDTTRIETQESSGSLRSILPASIGLGFGYSRREHLYLAADWTYQPWSRSRSFGEDQGLVDAWNLGVGGYYQPMSLDKYKAGDVYWSIVKYKLGFKYGSGYLKLQEQNISNLGITFGLSLPVRGAKSPIERYSNLNIGVELGQRGSFEQDLIRERYIQVNLGFSLVDRWFIKRRYD
jgi:long-subunit fatty acid transport protein